MNQLQHTKSYIDDFVIALSHNRKISLKYLLVSLPVALCLGTICFIGKGIDSEFSLKVCQLVIFAATGLFHLYLLKKKISFFRLRIFGEGIMYTLSMSVVICIVLLAFYLFTDNSMALMAIASSAAFALPHIVLQAWVFLKNIPGKQYSLWTAPARGD
ncbi:MAG: TssN family type VI secretion system protein, partial [Bacteroidota bacterium]